jgi:phosphoribosylformylglycinamidine synthase subunit PurL
VSGNVSLYNETDGQPILPTPTIGAVGLIADAGDCIIGKPVAGDVALVVGATRGHLGQSALLAEVFGIEEGDAPPVDLDAEKASAAVITACAKSLHSCTDLGDGGLALAGFRMAEGAGLGLTLTPADIPALFGEDQARYLIACAPEAVAGIATAAEKAGVQVALVGSFGGTGVQLGTSSATMADLSAIYRGAFATAVG